MSTFTWITTYIFKKINWDINSLFRQILRKKYCFVNQHGCLFTWLQTNIFTFEWLVTLEVFSGFFICIDFEKETKSKQEKRSDCSQQHHKKGRHASFLYYFKNKEYNIITQENSNGWIYFNRTNKKSNLKNWDSFALVRIFLFLFLLLLFLFLFFFAFRSLSKNKQNKIIYLLHNK